MAFQKLVILCSMLSCGQTLLLKQSKTSWECWCEALRLGLLALCVPKASQ